MPGFPRTLLGRTALIIVTMLLASQLVALQLFRLYYNGPLLEESAERAVSQIRTIGAAIQVLTTEEREEFLDLLESREHIRVLYDSGNILPSNTPAEDFLRAFAAKLRAVLGRDTEFFVQAPRGQALWVKLPVGAEQLWIGIPRAQIGQPFPWLWIASAGAIAALAIAAAYLLLRRVNRPLRDLAAAARSLGRGEFPQPVSEQGPEEIRSVGATFNAMLADLKRQDQERAVLLAGISHDLRTPLARMRLGIEMLEGDAGLKADMIKDAEEMDAIVGQFLDFARAQGEEKPVAADLDALAQASCEGYARRGERVRYTPGGSTTLTVRPVALKRAVTNLIDNALKYTGSEVEVSTEVTGDRAVIRVLDRGPGIPDADIERMLRPFTRLESARSGATGAGLGLAIVSRIARLHGGAFKLSPREGGGLEARIELKIS